MKVSKNMDLQYLLFVSNIYCLCELNIGRYIETNENLKPNGRQY